MIKEYKNFNLNKNNLNKGLTILVKSQGFMYDHDEVYAHALNRADLVDNKFSLLRGDGYSATKGYPGWASDFIKSL